MQLEELYHRKLENVSDTAELRMHAVMMVAEQKQTYTFAVTERQQVIYDLSDFLIMILSWLVKQSLRAFLLMRKTKR